MPFRSIAKIMSLLTYTALVFTFSFSLSSVNAHSGRTDSKGGHYDRINGGYHYHNKGDRPLNADYIIEFLLIAGVSFLFFRHIKNKGDSHD
jgi:hypothetical protein